MELQILAGYVLGIVKIVVLVTIIYALVHAAMQRPDAYTAVDKLTKPVWLVILGLGLLLALVLDITGTAIAAAVVALFGSLYPDVMPSTTDPAFSLTVDNASSTPYTLRIMSVVALVMTPVVIGYQAWSYWVFRKRIGREHIPAPTDPARTGPPAAAPAEA